MEIQTIWLVILAISSPIAGIVGFAIQLRSTKKLRLENEKLQLESVQLKIKAEKESRRIVEPTSAEVEKYTNQIRYSLGSSSNRRPKQYFWSGFTLGEILAISIALFLIIYFVYDLYRLFSWLWYMF